PDDTGIHGWLDGIKRKARLFASDEKYVLPDAGAHTVYGNERLARRLARRRQWLHEQQLDAGETLVFSGNHHGSDDSRDLHGQSLTVTVSTTPTMAASTGQSFIPDAIRAELPLTMSTVSPTPASTVSTATR